MHAEMVTNLTRLVVWRNQVRKALHIFVVKGGADNIDK